MDVEDEFDLKNYDNEDCKMNHINLFLTFIALPSFAQETKQILTGSKKKDQYPDVTICYLKNQLIQNNTISISTKRVKTRKKIIISETPIL